MILNYEYFKASLNSKLFEDNYSDLLRKIAENPERYIGIFRPTKPKTKLIQNITQSHEIRFGDALEFIFERYFEASGFQLHTKRFRTLDDTDLSIDQLFSNGNVLYMIEQKVRDDHDSTKKVGQFDNFENKYFALSQRYPNYEIRPFMWFIDDSLEKNRRYYLNRMQSMSSDYGCQPELFYGEQLFSQVDDFNIEIWHETLDYLERWKATLPDMPEINFDNNAEVVFEEVKDLPPIIYRKLLNNMEVRRQIFPIIFPNNTVLGMLCDYFFSKSEHIYHTLAELIVVRV